MYWLIASGYCLAVRKRLAWIKVDNYSFYFELKFEFKRVFHSLGS